MTDINKPEVLERVRNEIKRLTKMVEWRKTPLWSGAAIEMWTYDLKFYQAIESLLTAPTDQVPDVSDDTIFINHIQSHLAVGQVVVCKIYGKSAYQIIGEVRYGK